MTWDILAIPAMSAECERIFSSASHLITSLQGSLQDKTIEVNKCLKTALAATPPTPHKGKRKYGAAKILIGQTWS